MAFAGDDCYDTPIEAQSIQILIMNVEILSNNICYMRKHSSETGDMLIKLLKAINFTRYRPGFSSIQNYELL